MAEPALLLDACVLVPAALRDLLLRLAEGKFFAPRWSAAILDELERALLQDIGLSPAAALRLSQQLGRAFPDAEVAGYESLLGWMLNHPKDRHVLAAAVHTQAAAIVTFNARDFPSAATEPYGIAVWHPDDLLGSYLAQQPDAILTILRQQAEALPRPSRSFEQLLSALALSAPEFTRQLRAISASGSW